MFDIHDVMQPNFSVREIGQGDAHHSSPRLPSMARCESGSQYGRLLAPFWWTGSV